MRKILGCLVVTCTVLGAPRAAATDDRWIHVRVDEATGGKGRVDIQVPVGWVSSLLPALDGLHGHGSIHVGGQHVRLGEMRDSWNAVRAARDGEYVRVRDEDSDVRISKRGGYLHVTADDEGDGSRIRMKVPLALVEAVLAGGDTLDFDALGAALAKVPPGELLTVDDEESHVRIWIDGRPTAAREDRP